MKKIVTLILSLLLIAALSLSAAASSVSLATEIANMRTYYAETKELELWEETLVFAAMGMLTERTPFLPEEMQTADRLAQRALAQMAIGATAETDALKALQNEDGSFGAVDVHCLSMLALKGNGVLYNSVKAYAHLLAQQKEDGSFGASVKETALAITVLSLSDNEEEVQAYGKAVQYLLKHEAKNCEEIAWQIIGITDGNVDAVSSGGRDLLQKLLDYQNPEEYYFYRTENDNTADRLCTATALMALDTVNKDGSLFKRLATDGTVSFFDPADLIPLGIFFGVLLCISVGFWVFIFKHKKSTKTLADAKKY